MRISRLAEGLQTLGSDKHPNFWKKRFVPFLSPQKGPRPPAAEKEQALGLGASGWNCGFRQDGWLPARWVRDSRLQRDKVKELSKEGCLLGMEKHFKRKQN